MNAYLLVFDRNINVDYNRLHEGIKSDPNISNWSHYLLSSYILLSRYDANQLTDSIREYFPNHKFLVMQVYPNNYNGWLPQEAWTWIRNNIGG